MVSFYDSLGGQLHYSALNEARVALPRFVLQRDVPVLKVIEKNSIVSISQTVFCAEFLK